MKNNNVKKIIAASAFAVTLTAAGATQAHEKSSTIEENAIAIDEYGRVSVSGIKASTISQADFKKNVVSRSIMSMCFNGTCGGC